LISSFLNIAESTERERLVRRRLLDLLGHDRFGAVYIFLLQVGRVETSDFEFKKKNLKYLSSWI
jgi:hypothetical protein